MNSKIPNILNTKSIPNMSLGPALAPCIHLEAAVPVVLGVDHQEMNLGSLVAIIHPCPHSILKTLAEVVLLIRGLLLQGVGEQVAPLD